MATEFDRNDKKYIEWVSEQDALSRDIMDEQEMQQRYYDEMLDAKYDADVLLNPVSFPIGSPTIDDTSVTRDVGLKR